MTTTVRDLLTGSLRLISVVSEGDTPSAEQLNNALYTMTEMIDSWDADGDMIYTQSFHTFPINSSKLVWTIGPGGDFDVPHRPVSLEYAAVQITSASPVLDVPMEILTAVEYASIRSKTITTSIPRYIYLEESYPLGKIYLWPGPSANANLVLTYWTSLSSTLTLDSAVSFPPGYQKLLRFGTAINIAAEYGRQVNPEIAAIYNDVKNHIYINNVRSDRLLYDQNLLTTGTYNVFDDNTY